MEQSKNQTNKSKDQNSSINKNRPNSLQITQKRQKSNKSQQELINVKSEQLKQQYSSQLAEPGSSVVNKASSTKVQQLIQMFKINEISSRGYRQIIQQIAQSFTTMDSLTDRLEQKVDKMLKQQQLQFIQSYKSHMKKIQQQFKSIDKTIEEYEKKIKYYENEGQMSQLFIKVNKLQEQCRKLYKDIANKQKVNKDHELTIKVQRSQLKRYEKELKLLLRQKNQLLLKIQQYKDNTTISVKQGLQSYKKVNDQKDKQDNIKSQREDIQNTLRQLNSINSSTNHFMFPTQLQTNLNQLNRSIHNIKQNKQKINDKILSDKLNNDQSTQYQFGINQSRSRQHFTINNQHLINKPSQKSLTIDLSLQKNSLYNPHHLSNYQISPNYHLSPHSHLSPQAQLSPNYNQTPLVAKVRQMQLKKQLNSLKKKNQLLNSFQSYVLQAKTDMQTFFINCVNQIKQQIKIKKKINYCTFQDFKKQDKIQLLIKIITNDDILAYLYQRLFKKKKLFINTNQQMYNKEEFNQTNSLSHIQKSLHQIIKDKTDIQSVYIKSKLKSNAQLINKKVIQNQQSKQKSLQTKNNKNHAIISGAKRRFSKHISDNSLLPKIHFHLQY